MHEHACSDHVTCTNSCRDLLEPSGVLAFEAAFVVWSAVHLLGLSSGHSCALGCDEPGSWIIQDRKMEQHHSETNWFNWSQ